MWDRPRVLVTTKRDKALSRLKMGVTKPWPSIARCFLEAQGELHELIISPHSQ